MPSLRHSSSSMTSLSMMNSAEDSMDGNIFDIEEVRKQFESLLRNNELSFLEQSEPRLHQAAEERISTPVLISSACGSCLSLPEAPPLDVKVPLRPPLTSIERERRLAEIELLGHLSDGDEAILEIKNLWSSERGSRAASVLQKADELMEQGSKGQRDAELLLRSLIEEYGVYFTEPVNRLATLYYVQGRLEESLTLNEIVLFIKPWHIGALSHIVMVHAALHDPVSARQWAAFRLPSLAASGSNRRRISWVERAVIDGTILLHEGEKNNSASFGIPDQEWIEKQIYDNDNTEAWQ